MLHYEAIRQMTVEHRLHHEAEAELERMASQARDGRAWPPAGRVAQLRDARRDALQRAGYVVVTVWPRR